MMKGRMLWVAPLLGFLLGSSGCTNTVRYMTTMTWLSTPAGAVPATLAPPGAALAGAAQTDAAPGGGGDGTRAFYVTYWEGSCSSGLFGFGKGCSAGDSKIRRCNPNPDNSLSCVEEPEATQAFSRKK